MPYSTLDLTFPRAHIAVAAFNRPEAANALNAQMARELAACFGSLGSSIRAVVLTGAGQRAFCAGADLKERKGMDERQWEAQHRLFRQARDAVLHCPLPVIAAVNGAAFGSGLELALVCDFIYAAESARFALPEAMLGFMPGMGGTQTLLRAIGERRASELMMTGRTFTAQEALVWGMVNRICTPEKLLEEALATAAMIAAAAPLSVRALKRVMQEGTHLPLEKAFAVERKAYLKLVKTKDRHEGINAFNEKRKPEFKGA